LTMGASAMSCLLGRDILACAGAPACPRNGIYPNAASR
jgi:hypothetical protein